MRLSPRYDGPPILQIEGEPNAQLAPLTRQHRRLQAMASTLTDEQWNAASRCDGWAVRDVVAHLVGVNTFWRASVVAGLTGNPTRVLGAFDPAATPPLMVGPMAALGVDLLLEQFVTTSNALLEALADLDDTGWSTLAESPAGHVPIHLLAQHAMWDSWIHERDIALPLDIDVPDEPDELRSCLQYAAVVSPVLGIGLGRACAGVYAVEATDADVRFVLDVDESVSLRVDVSAGNAPCLRGDTVALIEALSLRAPLPQSTPPEWIDLLLGLETAFDAV